ncbi:glycine dehydrogenase (aminomethyl-transferring) [PVC group bacterium (ex Bugula neritina AB1)]|nr:glycine dehydrogenase (aminomethyl-transferring) [PVC group bacterium (ex Bugula neritina AB1)]
MSIKNIFEKSSPGRKAFTLQNESFDHFQIDKSIDKSLLRETKAHLPEVSELDTVRHYTGLSQKNRGIDNQFYPLGSCTMKYNPRIHEEICMTHSFANIHPLAPSSCSQGNLHIIHELQEMLSTLSGMHTFCLQPAAGAHGELAGLMLIKAYHKNRGQADKKDTVLIPDTAHGTNPASAALCGYKVKTIRSNSRGNIDIEHLKENLDESVAGFMTTNPNTLGLFDENILEISSLIHEAGGLLYYDGANFNAIMGKCRPGDMGFDVIHINLHKTFSTPHGGGGPGSGPIGVKENLIEFLPYSKVIKKGEKYIYQKDFKDKSIGNLMPFGGHFLVWLRAYIYIKLLGLDGLKDVSENAVLNANYLMRALTKDFHLPYDRSCMHEFILSNKNQKPYHVQTKHIAKRLIDKGYHPPTTYFPLIVEEALMLEPTETESLETLNTFIEAMRSIAKECVDSPDVVLKAPHSTPVSQIDEVLAARQPKLKWTPSST